MTEFEMKDYITDKDFIIHILNNLPMEHDAILNSLNICQSSTGPDAMTIEVIHGKLNYW